MSRKEFFAFERSGWKLSNQIRRGFRKPPRTLKEYRLHVALDAEWMNLRYGTTYMLKAPAA